MRPADIIEGRGDTRRVSAVTRWAMLCLLLVLGMLHAAPALASTCAAATGQGTAPADYQSYCWLDFTGYSDSAARNGGQPFTFNLSDGSTLKLTLSVSDSTTGTSLAAVSSPSYSGAAFGNSAFLGIPNNPVLYQRTNGATTVVTLSNISITPPPGTAGGQTTYAIIAADGESTNSGESLSFTTNGTAWKQLAQIANGSYFPTVTGVGTTTVTETGTQGGSAGSYVFGSFSDPTQISATLVGSGLQGVDFAVRFASVTVTTVINGARVSPSDQFTYGISTASGTTQPGQTQTSSGTGSGPFPLASAPTIAASYPFTVSETMASGSTSTLAANYTESLTCTNTSTTSSSTPTPLPNKINATSYTFSSVQFGDAIACVFTDTPYPNITGSVYGDTNHNGHIDPGEVGTGLSNIYVKLAPYSGGACQAPATVAVSAAPASGAYTVAGVAPGSYCLILDNNSTLSDIVPSVPAGWVALEAATGIRQVTVASSVVTAQNFGLYQGMSFSGTVFADTGAGGGTANNGVQDGGEAGIASVSVNAVSGNSTVATTVTSGSGSYTLWLPASVSGSVVITPAPPSGYLATGGSAGSSGGSYSRPSVTATTSSGLVAANVNFGLVPPNTLAPDGSQSASPGTVLFYPHRFVPASAGQITFSSAASAAPAVSGWVETLYRDVNCNGQLDSGDTLLTAAVTATAGQPVCVLVKEFVPANAPIHAQNQVVLSAAFSYTNAAPALAATLTRTDTTTVSLSGGVLLSKLVSNVTRGGAAGTSNNASPGDTLQYQLVVSNPGSAAVGQLLVSDATPAFTRFVAAACPASASLPTGLTACSVSAQPAPGAQGAVAWSFTGKLAPGATVSVSYQVTVSP